MKTNLMKIYTSGNATKYINPNQIVMVEKCVTNQSQTTIHLPNNIQINVDTELDEFVKSLDDTNSK